MTNPWLNDHADIAADLFLFAGLADDALYVPAEGGAQVACRVMIDRNLQDFGFQSRAASAMVTLQALVSEVGIPRRGAVFVVGSEQFMVDGAPLEADEAIIRVQVKQVAP